MQKKPTRSYQCYAQHSNRKARRKEESHKTNHAHKHHRIKPPNVPLKEDLMVYDAVIKLCTTIVNEILPSASFQAQKLSLSVRHSDRIILHNNNGSTLNDSNKLILNESGFETAY